jgi:hypothetical protein
MILAIVSSLLVKNDKTCCMFQTGFYVVSQCLYFVVSYSTV